MLKSETVTRIWKCDKCGEETAAESSPYNRVIVQNPVLSERIPACSIDLCSTCIGIVEVQAVADYLANLAE